MNSQPNPNQNFYNTHSAVNIAAQSHYCAASYSPDNILKILGFWISLAKLYDFVARQLKKLTPADWHREKQYT
jgi:hypothetical protein